MLYGLPYKGSKNKIAKKIVDILPSATHFYDLFCGGCAISHYAMTTGKYQHIHINDINPMCPQLFVDCLDGKYNNDDRWISREDFFRLKDSDPIVAFVWSFGNNLRDYLYGRKIEPWKKALHYLLYFRDASLVRAFGYDMEYISQIENIEDRYAAIRSHLKNTPPTKRHIAKLLSTSARVQCYERRKRMRLLGGVESCIDTSSCDYSDFTFEKDSIIYCDIPYKDTDVYGKDKFDYERFYEWCSLQEHPVFISEYDMPADRFVAIAEINHTSSLCATSVKKTKERIFVPKHQYNSELYENTR